MMDNLYRSLPAAGYQQAGVTPEIVAAITGAIAAVLKSDSSQLAILAVRAVPNRTNNWLYTGRKALTEKSYELALLRRRSRI